MKSYTSFRLVPLLMTLKYIWRSFQPRLSFPCLFQQSLACFRVARSPSNSWASCFSGPHIFTQVTKNVQNDVRGHTFPSSDVISCSARFSFSLYSLNCFCMSADTTQFTYMLTFCYHPSHPTNANIWMHRTVFTFNVKTKSPQSHTIYYKINWL